MGLQGLESMVAEGAMIPDGQVCESPEVSYSSFWIWLALGLMLATSQPTVAQELNKVVVEDQKSKRKPIKTLLTEALVQLRSERCRIFKYPRWASLDRIRGVWPKNCPGPLGPISYTNGAPTSPREFNPKNPFKTSYIHLPGLYEFYPPALAPKILYSLT